jgi:GntR family transcriptional regulator, arabinose operon transcriptional repressor
VPSQRPSTARARLVAALTEEILHKNEQTSFPISSEHQLCRRFNVSRVTVRLALGDLENRGLIYRKHGKGTFAHGRLTRQHRYLGILMKSPLTAAHRTMAEMIRGAQTVMASVNSAVLLISTSPEEWRSEKASSLGGVIVVPQNVTEKDLEILKNRNLPFLLFTESNLTGPRVMLGQREAARHMTEQLLRLGHRHIALLSGYDICLDAPKRMGVHDALREAGIDPAQVPEFSSHEEEGSISQAVHDLLHLNPRPTAVVAFDDSLGSILSFQARRQEGIQVPAELSIVSFHDWPYLNFIEPALSTVRFEFLDAGVRATKALNHAALTGEPVTDIFFSPAYRPGQTIGPVLNNS